MFAIHEEMHQGVGQSDLLGKTDLRPLKPRFGDACLLGGCLTLGESSSLLWHSHKH